MMEKQQFPHVSAERDFQLFKRFLWKEIKNERVITDHDAIRSCIIFFRKNVAFFRDHIYFVIPS